MTEDALQPEEFRRAVEMYESATSESERHVADAARSEKIYSNDHGDVVILNDAAGNQIARVGLDSQTVI